MMALMSSRFIRSSAAWSRSKSLCRGGHRQLRHGWPARVGSPCGERGPSPASPARLAVVACSLRRLLLSGLEVGRKPPDRCPRCRKVHEPPCRCYPENPVCNYVELPPRDGQHEDHCSEHGGERADAKDDSPKIEFLQDPSLHGERAAHEPKRPGDDERTRAASKERPGIAKAQREGESPARVAPAPYARSAR